MVFYKFFSSIFSNVKTIQRTIQLSKSGNLIQLKPKLYRESIHFEKNIVLAGDPHEETVIEGFIIVPKNVTVTIQNITICPTAQMYIEGEVVLQNCHFKGEKNDTHITVDGGKLNAYHCQFERARDIAIISMNHSKLILENCHFTENGKTHLFAESSQICIEKCEFSFSKHGLMIKNGSLVQSRSIYIHHHQQAQIIVEASKYIDHESVVEFGEGHGLHILQNGKVTLHSSIYQYHQLAQINVLDSLLCARYCSVLEGEDFGIFATKNSEVQAFYCEFGSHKKSNLLLTKSSKMNLQFCKIYSSDSHGIHISNHSILNIFETVIKGNQAAQISVLNHSICSMKNCVVKEGNHVGICIENGGNCSIVECDITYNANSSVTLFHSTLTIYKSTLAHNVGNGILAMSNSNVEIELCRFFHNEMPHIACKSNVKLSMNLSDFSNGKSLFIINDCELTAVECQFYDSHNVQIEICDLSTAKLEQCQIYNGKSYGIKVLRNSSLYLFDSQLFNHELSQIVVNDSSIIMKNSELFDGKRNALSIQNHSEVFVQDCFISKHVQHQVWIDFESTVELKSVQLTDGTLSDIFAQNQSSVYITDSVIRNTKSPYNVQAVNFSKINLLNTIVENSSGDVYYSENHSHIEQLDHGSSY